MLKEIGRVERRAGESNAHLDKATSSVEVEVNTYKSLSKLKQWL